MSARPFHKRYHSDALAGFMALTLEERGAYQTLLDLMYDRGGPIADNERLLAGYMGVSLRKWKSLRDDLIGKGKIHLTDEGLLSNSRVEKELENDVKTSRKHAENGLKGARKKHETPKNFNENSESGVARLEQNSGLPDTRSHIPDIPPTPNADEGDEKPRSDPSAGRGSGYVFPGKTIRLNQADFDRWKAAYHAIADLRAELTSIDDWLDGADEQVRKRWFHSVSRMLGRKHDEAVAAGRNRSGGAGTDAFIRRFEAFQAKQKEAVKP
jgi:uncharacterized protein YdaU (DUF1376 family)